MRLAAVPIAYHLSYVRAAEFAARSSRATHPDPRATACARFLAFFLSVCILTRKAGREITGRDFTPAMAQHFLNEGESLGQSGDSGSMLLEALLRCQPPSTKEAHWNWRLKELPIQEAVAARRAAPGGKYNDFEVTSTYFGSYCLDGLAMALWAVYNGTDFASTLRLAVNLLGDADTVGAIAGQMAGAIYGWTGIMADRMGEVCLENVRQWDPHAEIGLRAALLYFHGPVVEVTLKQAEGFPTVRVYDSPAGGKMIGSVPSGSKCVCLDTREKFVKVRAGSMEGWVGVKNSDLITPMAHTSSQNPSVVPDAHRSEPKAFGARPAVRPQADAQRPAVPAPRPVVQAGAPRPAAAAMRPAVQAKAVQPHPKVIAGPRPALGRRL